MSVGVLLTDSSGKHSMVPVATEATYRTVWQPGAEALALDWIQAAQFGIDVTSENRAEILDQFRKLRDWFGANGFENQNERVDLVMRALEAIRFDAGETASIG